MQIEYRKADIADAELLIDIYNASFYSDFIRYGECPAYGKTKEAKIYKALDKLEALIQHNESPLYTWSENEYELNKTYAFNTVEFSEWLTTLRQEILQDTLDKIERGE